MSTKQSASMLVILAACLLLSAPNSSAFQSAMTKYNKAVLSPGPCHGRPVSLTFPRSREASRLFLFFGKEEVDTKDKELVSFPKLATSNTDVKFESLAGFITTWSQKFEDNRKEMGLTTPVKVTNTLEEREEDDSVAEQAGVRILFQATKTGYKNKKEEDASKTGDKKKKAPKEGGVEIRVQKLANGEVQVKARRCDTDEDTMIKEMSEEAIVSQLKKAVDAWKNK